MSNPAARIQAEILGKHPEAVVEKRTVNGVTYYLPGDKHSFNASQGSLHYLEDGYWRQIDTTLTPSAARVGADLGMVKAGFQSHFNLDLTAPWTAEYRKGASAIRLKPVRLQSGTKQWPVQPIRGVLKDDTIRWDNAFGPGIHLEWETQTSRLAKRVILDKRPTLTADLDLVLEVQLDNLALPGVQDKLFLPLGNVGFLRWPVSWDETGEIVKGKLLYSITGAKKYITHRVPRAWLEKALYPVTIDIQVDEIVGASADDTVCYYKTSDSTHHWANNSSAFTVGYQSAELCRRGSTARFTTIDIPRDVICYNSSFIVTPLTLLTNTICYGYLYCEDADNATQVADDADIHDRATNHHTTKVSWELPAMPSGTEYGFPFHPEEVFARPGWASGNALNVLFEDFDARSTENANTHRAAYAYDSSTTKCPKIQINWRAGVKPQGGMF